MEGSLLLCKIENHVVLFDFQIRKDRESGRRIFLLSSSLGSDDSSSSSSLKVVISQIPWAHLHSVR